MSMEVKAIAPWFGAKRNLADEIVRELGSHRVYWEPFCGSMAVLLAKPPCAMETVNDLNGDVVNLARVVQDSVLSVELHRRLELTLMSESLHREAALRWRSAGYRGDDKPDVDAAYDYFLCSWLGRNGVAGTSSYNQGFCVRYTANGGHSAKRWRSAIESIPAWWERLQNVTILCRDAFEVIGKIDDAPRTAIYVDPPYVRKGAKYIHDFRPEDHGRLADVLRRFKKSRVVVSYYDEPELAGWYEGWRKVPLKATKALVAQNMRGKAADVKAPEVLLINEAAGLF